jgi:stage II sporulation protein AA (anti-sigma F factor antagonist)
MGQSCIPLVREVMVLQIAGKKVKDTLVVSLEGELDHHTSSEVRAYIENLLEDPTIRNLIIDMKKLKFMDSSGLGVLLGRYKIISRRGGELGVTGINTQIDRIFVVSGLYKIIKAYDGLKQALNDIGGY